MAKSLTIARKDKAFQRVLQTLKDDTPTVPSWPFANLTPEQWDALPYRVKHYMESSIRSYLELANE